LIAVHGRLFTTSSLQFFPQETETSFIGREILLVTTELKEKVAHSQLTNYVSKSRKTYYTENTESRETERSKTEKLSTETKK